VLITSYGYIYIVAHILIMALCMDCIFSNKNLKKNEYYIKNIIYTVRFNGIFVSYLVYTYT